MPRVAIRIGGVLNREAWALIPRRRAEAGEAVGLRQRIVVAENIRSGGPGWGSQWQF